jgi:signal transduction histidine kinase
VSSNRGGGESRVADAVGALLSLAEDSPLAPRRALERGLGLLSTSSGADGAIAYMRVALSGQLVAQASWGEVPEAPHTVGEVADIPADTVIPMGSGGQAPGVVACWGVGPIGEADQERLREAAGLLGLIVREARVAAGLADRANELAEHNRRSRAQRALLRAAVTADPGPELDRLVVEEMRTALLADGVTLWQGTGPTATRRAASPGDSTSSAPEAPLTGVTELGDGSRGVALDHTGEVTLSVAPGPATRGLDDALVEFAAYAATVLESASVRAALSSEQRERQAVAAALVQAQDDARRRISEGLHDGPVQGLVGLGMQLEALANDLRRDGREEAARQSAAAAESARSMVKELREAISDLHPIASEEAGLAATVRVLESRLRDAGIEVDARVEGDVERGPASAAGLRVLKEAVANILRHAGAHNVAIRCSVVAGALRIRVEDDGAGFEMGDLSARLQHGHLGLLGLRQRVELAGGELRVESTPDEGTAVSAVIPLEERV